MHFWICARFIDPKNRVLRWTCSNESVLTNRTQLIIAISSKLLNSHISHILLRSHTCSQHLSREYQSTLFAALHFASASPQEKKAHTLDRRLWKCSESLFYFSSSLLTPHRRLTKTLLVAFQYKNMSWEWATTSVEFAQVNSSDVFNGRRVCWRKIQAINTHFFKLKSQVWSPCSSIKSNKNISSNNLEIELFY